jgi:hypothetical protein
MQAPSIASLHWPPLARLCRGHLPRKLKSRVNPKETPMVFLTDADFTEFLRYGFAGYFAWGTWS